MSATLIPLLLWAGCAPQSTPAPAGAVADTTSKPQKQRENWDFGNEDTITRFTTLEPRYVANRLFDQPKFDSLGYAVWRPNFNERMQFNVSFDDSCHSRLDTTMYWIDRDKRRCAVMVFSTEHFGRDFLHPDEIEISDCHFCGAVIGAALFFQREDGAWRLYDFQKGIGSLGIFGEYTKNRQNGAWISLRQIGDRWTCLVLKDVIAGNSGIGEGFENWYAIEAHRIGGFPGGTLHPIFGYKWYSSQWDWEKEIDVVERSETRLSKRPKSVWDLDLITRRARGDTVSHFVFDEHANQYVPRD